MDARVQGSRPTAVRWWVGALLYLLLSVYYAAASEVEDVGLRVSRIFPDRDREVVSLNPVSFFESTTAEFTCFCVNSSLALLDGRVELLHNGFRIEEGSCEGNAIYHVTTITVSDDGEYQCRVFFPGDNEPAVLSERRDLIVLDPDDINAPPVQYALYGSSYAMQCGVEDDSALVSWVTAGGDDLGRGALLMQNVSLADEGDYECEVYFSYSDVRMTKSVHLYVIMAPVITHPLPPTERRTDNTALSFVINFLSRFVANTSVMWYHDDHLIHNGIETEFSSDHGGRSTLSLAVVSRSNAGVYRVEVSNNLPSIPEAQRRASSSVELTVEVLPVLPTSVEALNLSKSSVQLTWQLPTSHPDQRADSISVLLTNITDLSQTEYQLPGSITNVIVAVVPGMRYRSVIVTRNTDGPTSTSPLEFRAATAAPNVMSVNAERLNMTSFNITTSLLYTGGSDITHFSVSFWKRNRTEWSDGLSVEAHASGTGMGLDWFGIMTSDGLAEPSELRVVVVNDVGHRSSPQTVQEKLAPLSAPSTPTLVTASHDSLTLSFILPHKGTPPVQHIIVNFTTPTHFQWECGGAEQRGLGTELTCTVPRLTSDTQYTLAVFGVGHAGRGNASSEVSYSTIPLPHSPSPPSHPHPPLSSILLPFPSLSSLPHPSLSLSSLPHCSPPSPFPSPFPATIDNSFPTWVVAVVSVVVAMTVLVVLLAVSVVAVHCCKLHQKKRHYHFSSKKATEQTSPKPLDPSHAILNRSQKPSMSVLSEVAPPVSPTSTLTPPPCRSTPSTTVTFKYETASGSSCSNLDSEISEAHSPTYTYRVSPPPPASSTTLQQSYPSLHRGARMTHAQSLHSTRESLASCPPAPTHCATNV